MTTSDIADEVVALAYTHRIDVGTMRDTAKSLSSRIADIGPFSIIGDVPYTVNDVSDRLRCNGWQVPEYSMPDNATEVPCCESS
jgi:hypothetical protein